MPSGGSGGGTNTTVSNTAPPPEVMQNYRDVTAQAKNVAQQPYPTYNGPLIAGFNPEQEAGFQNINTAASAGSPFINRASTLAENATTLLDPSHFGSTIAAYQNPFTSRVVDATQALQNNQNAVQLQQLRGNAQAANAFGGDREAVAEAELAKNQQLAEAPVIANLENQGFNTSLGAAQGNAWLNSQGAFSMGQLGQEAQQQGLAGANAQLQAGGMQQQLAQQQLNAPYQSFLAAQGYPYQTTGWLSNLDLGLGSAMGGNSSTTAPSPSGFSQVAGAGLTGASLIGASGGFGQNGWLSGLGTGAGNLASGNAWDGMAAGSTLAGLGSVGGMPADAAFAAGLTALNRGGRIRRAAGGPIPLSIPNLDISVIPDGPAAGGHSLLAPSGQTSTTEGGGGGSSEAASAIGTIATVAKIAAMFLQDGGRIERDAGGAVGGFGTHMVPPRPPTPHVTPELIQSLGGLGALASAVRAMRSGMTESDGGRVTGLDPVPVDMSGRGFDAGGTVGSPMFSGNPMLTQTFDMYANMPTEKLQELSARFTPGTQQGAMVARALQQRRMMPQHDPVQVDGGGFGAVPPAQGFADGGAPWDFEPDGPDDGLPVALAQRDAGEPLPPAAPAAALPAGGFGGASVSAPTPAAAAAPPSGRGGLNGSWGTLLAAGLGMMAGRSPNAGVNIGQGGLEGLKFGEAQRLRDEQQALRMQQQRWQQQYQAGLLDIRNKHEGTYADLASARAQQASAMAQVAMARAVGAIGNHATPGDLMAAGVADLMGQKNPETGERWTKADAIRHMNGLDIRQQNADTGATRASTQADNLAAVRAFNDRKLAYQQQGLDEKTAHDRAMVDLGYARAAVSGVTGSKDIMGKPGVTLEDENRRIRGLPGGGTGAPAAAAPPNPATLPDGAIVSQGGVQYRKQGANWLPVQ